MLFWDRTKSARELKTYPGEYSSGPSCNKWHFPLKKYLFCWSDAGDWGTGSVPGQLRVLRHQRCGGSSSFTVGSGWSVSTWQPCHCREGLPRLCVPLHSGCLWNSWTLFSEFMCLSFQDPVDEPGCFKWALNIYQTHLVHFSRQSEPPSNNLSSYVNKLNQFGSKMVFLWIPWQFK